VMGCVADGRRLNVNEQYADATQGVLFQCREEPNGAMAVCAIGCVVGGQSYMIGQQYIDGYKVMICNAYGRLCRGMLVGCVNPDDPQKRQYAPGQTWTTVDGEVVRCDIIGLDIQRTVVGCIRDTQGNSSMSPQVPVNAQWRQGTGAFQYQWTCAQDAQGNTYKMQNLCIYSPSGATSSLLINPGCYQKSPSDARTAVGCQQQTDKKTLLIVTFALDANTDASAQSYGVKAYC